MISLNVSIEMHRNSNIATDEDFNVMRAEISGLERDVCVVSLTLQHVSGSLNTLFRDMTKFLTPDIRRVIQLSDIFGNLRQISEVEAMLRMQDSPAFCVGDDNDHHSSCFPHAFDFGQPIVVTGTEMIYIVISEMESIVHCLTNERTPKFVYVQKRLVNLIIDDNGDIIRKIYDV